MSAAPISGNGNLVSALFCLNGPQIAPDCDQNRESRGAKPCFETVAPRTPRRPSHFEFVPSLLEASYRHRQTEFSSFSLRNSSVTRSLFWKRATPVLNPRMFIDWPTTVTTVSNQGKDCLFLNRFCPVIVWLILGNLARQSMSCAHYSKPRVLSTSYQTSFVALSCIL